MNCQNKISYIIRQGDTLYNIAAHYGTTVENILAGNPHLNIYNLRIGELITFCIDKNISDINNMYPADDSSENMMNDETDNEYVITLPELDLNNNIRMLWTQQCYWTRTLMVAIIEKSNDVDAINDRILIISKDMSSLYRNYYGSTTAVNMERILSNQLRLCTNLIHAFMNKNSNEITEIERQWLLNIDEISSLLSSINPFNTYEEIQGLLMIQFDLFKKTINLRLTGNFTGEIAAFDDMEQQALIIAELLTNSIVNQFPDAFF